MGVCKYKNIFFCIHLGYFLMKLSPFIVGEYLCLAEVQWIKTGVPEVKPLKEVRGIFPSRSGGGPFIVSQSDFLSFLQQPVTMEDFYGVFKRGLFLF